MKPPLLLRRGRLPGKPGQYDLLLTDSRVSRVSPAGSAPEAAEVPAGVRRIDMGGRMVLPGLVNAHCHLDKSLWADAWRPHTPSRSLAEMIGNERRERDEAGGPSADRIEALLRRMSAAGTTHVRTHTDVDPGVGVRGVTTVAEAAARVADLITVEQVAFPQSGLLGEARTGGLMAEALRLGVGTVGGLDPAGRDNDPVAHLDLVFGLAERFGVRVDIHLHDEGSLGRWQCRLIAERTAALGLQGRVAISHAFALGQGTPADRAPVLELLAGNGVAVHTCANFDDPVPPLPELEAAGVTCALGTDGIRDRWNPYGNGDMLEQTKTFAQRGSLRTDDLIAAAVRTATWSAARSLDLPGYGLTPGSAADLVVLDGTHLAEAVAEHRPRFLVVKSGAVVSGTGTRPAIAAEDGAR
ncbi:amidohydrolase [Kitasatospora sp. NPDC088783]|uniref:amidohydrolase n=1 Tax=Kitasatospora sp. NPDC088783 TaxID=3364077 RepID=UPI003818E00C